MPINDSKLENRNIKIEGVNESFRFGVRETHYLIGKRRHKAPECMAHKQAAARLQNSAAVRYSSMNANTHRFPRHTGSPNHNSGWYGQYGALQKMHFLFIKVRPSHVPSLITE